VSAKDIFHKIVKQAVEKDGWLITQDPLKLKFGDINFQIDLAAEKLIAAERADEKIELKSKVFSILLQLQIFTLPWGNFSVIAWH
jgi:hypothetical protein